MPARTARIAIRFAAAVVLTPVMAAVHLPTPTGRRAVRNTANALFASLFRGRLHIGSVDMVNPFGALRASGITLDDPQGRRVGDGGELEAFPLRELVNGLFGTGDGTMPNASLHVRRLALLRGESREPGGEWIPSIADAFMPRQAPKPSSRTASRPGPSFIFDRMRVSVDTITSELGGIDASAHSVTARGAVYTEPVKVYARTAAPAELRTVRLPPLQFTGAFRWRSRFVTARDGTMQDLGRMVIDADAEGDGVDCHLTFVRENAVATLDSRGCRASSVAIDRAVGTPIGINVTLRSLHARQVPEQPWVFDVAGSLNDEPVELHAVLGTDAQRAEVTVHGLDLRAIRSELPPARFDGTLRAERRGDEWSVDGSAFRAQYDGETIPAIQARGRLNGATVVIDSLTAPSAGLTAHGEVRPGDRNNLGWIEANLDTPRIEDLPFARGQIRGALRADVRVEHRDGRFDGTVRAGARSLRAQQFRAGSASIDGTFRIANGTPDVRATVRGDGVVIAGNGPLAVRSTITGNPLDRLQGRLEADGTTMLAAGAPGRPATGSRTRVDATFDARVGADGIDVRVARSPFELRGATGEIEGRARIPLSGGTLQADGTVTLRDGARATVALRGQSVSGTFDRFPLEWAGRALGLPGPLRGTLEGDLSMLTNRAARSHGTLRWRDGSLPYVGDFDLEVSVDHEGPISTIHAVAQLGADRRTLATAQRRVIDATVQVVPPRDLGDGRAWLQGLRQVDAQARNLPLENLSPLLPRGAYVGGVGAVHVRATRPEPDAPLETVIGVDLRNVQLAADVTSALRSDVRSALARYVRRQVPRQPLTEMLRLRGAVCTRLAGGALTDLPLALDAVLGREVGEAIVAPPEACTEDATRMRERIVRTAGTMEGPWTTAATALSADLDATLRRRRPLHETTLRPTTREALSRSAADVTVQIGAIDSDRWPFTQTMAAVVPALGRPPLRGTSEGTITVRGSLLAPVVTGDARVRTSGLDALVARDELAVVLHGELRPDPGPLGIFGSSVVNGAADAHLIAFTGRGQQDAGTAHATGRARGELLRVLEPSAGLRAARIEQLQIDTSRLQLGRLRWARANTIDGLLTLTLRDTGDSITPIAGNATIEQLRVRNQRPSSASLNVFVRNNEGEWEVQGCATTVGASTVPEICDPDEPVESAPPNGLRAGITLPLKGDLLAFTPDLGGVRAAVAAREYRLENISPLLETAPIVRVGGLFTGNATWTARAPRSISGRIQINDGLLDLERIGTPARNVVIDIDARGRRADINRIAFRLGDGSLEARGNADLTGTGDHITTVTLHGSARRLPAVQEGNVYGVITGEVDYTGTFRTIGHRGRARIQTANIDVPVEGSRTLQEIEPDPDVFIIGETRISAAPPTRAYPIDVDYTTETPVRLHRNDFDIYIRSNGHIHYDPAGLALSGQVEQAFRRSYYEFFGKRFYFDRINIQFDGSLDFNPLLDVIAHHDSPSIGRINLYVNGRFSEPEIRLASERYPGASQSEVIALLMFGRRETRGAADQTRITEEAGRQTGALITALAFGLAGNVLQQQMRSGSVTVPFLSGIIAEPGATGLQSGRYGLRFNPAANLYVEGTYGAASLNNRGATGQTSAQAQEIRTYIEWSISEHISLGGTGGVTTSGPTGGRWGLGVDLFWSP